MVGVWTVKLISQLHQWVSKELVVGLNSVMSSFSLTYSLSTLGSPAKMLHILHNTEFPLSTFACVESGCCLISDRGFDSILSKMKSCYERKGAKIEVC